MNPQKINCEVLDVYDHGDHVYTLILKPTRLLPKFKPGQFLHLAIDDYSPGGFWPDSRVFSIASSPTSNLIRICYSVKGKFTLRMESEIRKGSSLWIKMPYGEFTIDGETDVVLIAGGTGITAFIAYLENLKPDNKQRISLFYGAKNMNLLIFKEKLIQISKSVKSFFPIFFLETEIATFGFEVEIPYQHGRLSIEKIWPQIPNPLNKIYYLSGPPTMLKVFSNELKNFSIPEQSIRIDAWE